MNGDLGPGLRRLARPLGGPPDLNPLLELLGDARYVLLGESTHGSAQFYRWRAEITRRLVREHGFSFVAVEGDWPDCIQVNRYIRREPGAPATAREALRAYDRWPTWLWANEEVVPLVEWLRDEGRAAFYGIDLYSLWRSLGEVLHYVHTHDPEGVPAALAAFTCFDQEGGDVRPYARGAGAASSSCVDEVSRLLADLRTREPAGLDREARFDADQNAFVVWNAERYYRTLASGNVESWNVRQRHMLRTVERLVEHHGEGSRAIVWAHNTHVGDARATDMSSEGRLNLGQLLRQAHGEEGVVTVGFGTYEGTVAAARDWNLPVEALPLPAARRGSWEGELHEAIGHDALFLFRDTEDRDLLKRRGHRAIGVVYDPGNERDTYVPTSLPRRYDAFLWLERTTATSPLHDVQTRLEDEWPETWPTGM